MKGWFFLLYLRLKEEEERKVPEIWTEFSPLFFSFLSFILLLNYVFFLPGSKKPKSPLKMDAVKNKVKIKTKLLK